jgi:hypothetical protein
MYGGVMGKKKVKEQADKVAEAIKKMREHALKLKMEEYNADRPRNAKGRDTGSSKQDK